jgi:hypothetical protein
MKLNDADRLKERIEAWAKLGPQLERELKPLAEAKEMPEILDHLDRVQRDSARGEDS